METSATQNAAQSLVLITRIFGIVDKNSSPLHVAFCICVSISALALGTRVIQTSLKNIDARSGSLTLDLVSLIYQVWEQISRTVMYSNSLKIDPNKSLFKFSMKENMYKIKNLFIMNCPFV